MIVNWEKDSLKRSTSVGGSNQSFPLELIRPNSPSKVEKSREYGDQMNSLERTESPGEHTKYGTLKLSSLSSKTQNPQQLLPDGARNGALSMGERRCIKDHRKYEKGHKEGNDTRKCEGQKHQWTVRVSKDKEFHRLYDKVGVLEKKNELGNLYFKQLGNGAPTGKVPHCNSNSAEDEGRLRMEGLWHVEVSGRGKRQGTLENIEASRLIKSQRSRDDSDVCYGGLSMRDEEGRNRCARFDDKDINMRVNLSDWALEQKERHRHGNAKKRYLFSDTNLNDVKCTSLWV